MAKLIVLDGTDKGKVVPIKSKNIIGRQADCSVVLKDKGVSSHHCKVERISEQEFRLTDLGSSNGTYLNGRTVQEIRLNYGDIILVGKTRILFQPDEQLSNSTSMFELKSYIEEENKWVHCNRPMAKEWKFCPYCGEPL